MKKFLCVVLALAAVFCFAGCEDHDDGKCDECGTEGGLINKVVQYDEETELCGECALKKGLNEIEDELMGK